MALYLICITEIRFLLSRCLSVEIDGNEGVENIGDPSRYTGRYIPTDGEGRGDGHKEDV